MPFPRPVVVLSRCLEIAPCRYNGERIPFPFLAKLSPHADIRPVCPEVEIGLGVPRDPIRIIEDGSGRKLLQPATGRDVTRAMRRFAAEFLGGLEGADGFILKSRSPSCGIRAVKLYGGMEESSPIGRGAGLFAGQVLARFPGLAVEDEARLARPAVRERFLTRLFALASFRKVKERPSLAALGCYQERNRLLLMAHNRREAEALERIAANRERLPLPKALEEYEKRLRAALARPARRASAVEILRQSVGATGLQWAEAGFRPAKAGRPPLPARERARLLRAIERYQSRQIPLGAALRLLRGWIGRRDDLAGQSFFAPFPPELAEAGEDAAVR